MSYCTGPEWKMGVLAERGIWWQLQAGWKAFAIVVSYETGNEAFWASMERKNRPMYGVPHPVSGVGRRPGIV
jgi:hypothetical protein